MIVIPKTVYAGEKFPNFAGLKFPVLGKKIYQSKSTSGHFHSGEFRFNEYDINLCAEFDDSFQEKLNLMNRSNSMLRLCFVNWINEKILK